MSPIEKPGFWLKLRSYFFEKIIEKAPGTLSPGLRVELVMGRYMLNTNRVNYAFGDLDAVFRKAFKKISLENRKAPRVLVLGLGPGNIPTILREYPGPYQITGVEIDPEVIRLGNKYFGLSQHTNLEIVTENAVDFVLRSGAKFDLRSDIEIDLKSDAKFDLITVDLFIEDLVPPEAETEQFLQKTEQILAPGGLLLYNRLGHTADLETASLDFFKRCERILPGIRYFKVNQNLMLCYEKN